MCVCVCLNIHKPKKCLEERLRASSGVMSSLISPSCRGAYYSQTAGRREEEDEEVKMKRPHGHTLAIIWASSTQLSHWERDKTLIRANAPHLGPGSSSSCAFTPHTATAASSAAQVKTQPGTKWRERGLISKITCWCYLKSTFRFAEHNMRHRCIYTLISHNIMTISSYKLLHFSDWFVFQIPYFSQCTSKQNKMETL